MPFHPCADVSGVCERGPLIDEPMAWHNKSKIYCFISRVTNNPNLRPDSWTSLSKEKVQEAANQAFTRLGVNRPDINLEHSHTEALHDLWVHNLWEKHTVSSASLCQENHFVYTCTYRKFDDFVKKDVLIAKEVKHKILLGIRQLLFKFLPLMSLFQRVSSWTVWSPHCKREHWFLLSQTSAFSHLQFQSRH